MEITLRNIWHNRSLRRLCPVANLVMLINKVNYGDHKLRDQIAAELIMRGWLYSASQGGGPRGLLDSLSSGLGKLMSPQQIAIIQEWCRSQAMQRSFEVPSEWEGFAEPLQKIVKYELENWRGASGFILFVPGKLAEGDDRHVGVALPFYLKREVGAHSWLFRDCNDVPIEGGDCDDIHKSIKEANEHWRRQKPYSDCFSLRMPTLCVSGDSKAQADFHLEGESAGLAVVLALARRALIGPEKSVFEMGASGVLGANGCLIPDGHRRDSLLAKEQLLQWMGVKHCFLPPCPDYSSRESIVVPEGDVGAFLNARIRDWAVPNGEFACSILGVEQELEKIQSEMRYGSKSALEAKEECQAILGKINGDISPRWRELRTAANMALAAAECHSGDPCRSAVLCDEVINDKGTGVRSTVLAIVRQVVNLTDLCRYASADEYAGKARIKLSHSPGLLRPAEQMDLELQVAGSLGQALCYWGLIDGSQRKRALVELRQAADLARELDGGCDVGEQRDVPRNQCYVYLTHALHYPESAEQVYREMEPVCASHGKTRQYLLRTRWLSVYRMALVGCRLPDGLCGLGMALPDREMEGGWLFWTSLKYRGTLRALQGDGAGARSDFAEASTMIDERMPLFKFIGATICLQAGESLMPHNPAVAASYLRKAVAQFDEYRDWFVAPVSGREWLCRASGLLAGKPPNSLPNPQMCYPY